MAGVIPREYDRLFALWEGGQGNLEDELLVYDFFRDEADYNPQRPLVLTAAGGLIGFFGMTGLDPESFGLDTFEEASDAIRRAMDNFSPARMDAELRGGSWEIGNTLERIPAPPPTLAQPQVASESIHYLWHRTNAFWARRTCYVDELTWTIHYLPRARTTAQLLKLRKPEAYVELITRDLNRLAAKVRHTLKAFEEDLVAYQTKRPKMGFELAWMDEAQIQRHLFRRINHRFDQPPAVDPDVPLISQVTTSTRKNHPGQPYQVDQRACAVLTFKKPPKDSVGFAFRELLGECHFPFTLVNQFQSLDESALRKRLERNLGFATGLARTNAAAAEWKTEAEGFLGSLQVDGAVPFQWKFAALLCCERLDDFQDRLSRLQSWLKRMAGAQPMEESFETRMLAELSTIPGNGFLNQRDNVITSKNVGDLALVWRLHHGSRQPHLFFGDRQGGCYGFDLFDPALPNWNGAVLGGSGTGKSMLMNLQMLGLASFPSQIYVIDMGNSFGTIFQFLKETRPQEVAIMRIEGGEFSFNPLPLVQAIQDRANQIRAGRYLEVLEDGSQIPCPVVQAKELFEGWIKVLVGQGRELSPEETYRLDRALNGKDGNGGYFLQFESLCQAYLDHRQTGADPAMDPPEPLTELVKFVRSEAPELIPSLLLWTRGSGKKYFDSGRDTLATAKMVYFELSGLTTRPELTRPFVAALMATIWRRITNPFLIHEKKSVTLDEGWVFLMDPAFQKVLDTINRTIRKYSGYLVVSTQTPDEIMKGDNIKFLRNMAHQWIYKGFSCPEYFKQHLRMTDEQVQDLETLRQDHQSREVYHWDSTGMTRMLEVVVDPHRYWYATTNGDDRNYRARFVKHFGSITAGVEALVEACEGRTIASGSLRTRLVEDYAHAHQIP
jgi:hypothetical protein